MNLRRTKLGLIVGLATVAGACIPAEAATLKDVKINPLMAGQTAIEFQFDGNVQYTDVLKYRPDYLLVNVQDSDSDLIKNNVDINRGMVKDLLVQKSGKDLQLKVNLKELLPYKVAQKGNSLVVTLGQSGEVVAAKVNANVNGGSINSINNVDFRREGKDGIVVVDLDNSSAAVDVRRRGDHLIVTFNSTNVASDQIQNYDVSDFGTQVKGVFVSKKNNNAIVDIACLPGMDYKTEQTASGFVVKVFKKEKPKQDLPKYNGKPISLNFQDVPVRTVLQLIADFNNFNLVTTDTVGGNITLRLDSVPWEQALETILRVKGLDKRLDGNILLVAQAKELADLEEQKLQSVKKVEELAPLTTEFIQINYAKANDLAVLLGGSSSSSSPNGDLASSNRILSPRGSVGYDQRTNTLIVKDTAEVLDKVQDIVKRLDKPIKQVTIEARIVNLDEDISDELGVNWNLAKTNNVITPQMGTSLAGYDSGDNEIYTRDLEAQGTNKGHYFGQTAFNQATQGLGISIGKVWDNILVDMYLSALESETKAEVIASPRVTTSDQKEAIIEQGTEFPTEVSTSSGATSVEWEKAVLGLKVTPQITPDNRIILDLTVTQDTLGKVVQTGTGQAQSINTQEVKTQVLVENGETIVLGGIYQQTLNKVVTKVPLLGDIPYLGALFRYTKNQNVKRELMVFVTPKIVVDKQ